MKISHSSSFPLLTGLLSGMILISIVFNHTYAQAQSKPFVSLVSSDETNRYFDVDLRQLPSFFDKAYFLELIFKDSTVVVQNSSLKNTFLPLSCNCKLETKQVLLRIEGLKTKVIRISASMSASEKAKIVKKFEKYR